MITFASIINWLMPNNIQVILIMNYWMNRNKNGKI